MKTRVADIDSAQARLQAWRSRRATATDWLALEAVLGLDEYLVRARQPPFGRWLGNLDADPSLHEIDRCLRDAFRRDCAIMARWYPDPWGTALEKLAAAVDLPLLAASQRGETASSAMLQDARWRAILEAPIEQRFSVATGLDASTRSSAPESDGFELWLCAWLDALPREADGMHAGFAELARAARAYRALGAAAHRDAIRTTSIVEALATLFRRYAGTPIAMACELASSVLDMHRLRAGLVQRSLAKRAKLVAA